jgi:nitrite reductase/ring-hydroxylating ferredoxin subunit
VWQTGSKPIAVYKDEDGNITKRSAICPHMKGVVCWNKAERTWDCPVHGSRFSAQGVCVDGPSKANLGPAEGWNESDHAAKANLGPANEWNESGHRAKASPGPGNEWNESHHTAKANVGPANEWNESHRTAKGSPGPANAWNEHDHRAKKA